MEVEPRERQSEVFALLQDPRTHGLSGLVTRIDTHGAAVFLADKDVYKVKRAVRFPFMDFSTLEKRRLACLAELTVNRDNAPDLYLGVVPITCEEGVFRIGGTGPAIEWAVHLKRFDETATFDHLAAKDALTPALIDKLAAVVVASHRRATPTDGAGATVTLNRLLEETVQELTAAAATVSEPVARLGKALLTAFQGVEALLLRRAASGQVRHCHGDLHLGNVVLIGREPVLFDAIEFDDAIATTDILYDLAFLLMDLWKLCRHADANRLMNAYLALTEDKPLQIEGLAALPFFMGLRAAVRAKIVAALLRLDPERPGLAHEFSAYLEAASGFLSPTPPLLLAIGGLSGTGKTTLASAVAYDLGRAPGALHLRSDLIRKGLFGVTALTHLPNEAYRPDISVEVQTRLHRLARLALEAGQAVVVDATYRRAEDRAAIATLAAGLGVPFFGIWLEAPVATLAERVTSRRGDASDATSATVVAQAEQALGSMTWNRLDSRQSVAEMARLVRDVVRVVEPGKASAPTGPSG